MKFNIVCCFLLGTWSLHGVSQTITQAGLYQIGGDISYTPSVSNDAVIYINASNVTVDLNNSFLSQSGGASGLRGVEIASGVSNVMVKNGTINGVNGWGVLVNSNCTNIRIQNIQCLFCDLGGIEFLGATTPNEIKDSVIENCSVLQCGLSGASTGIAVSNTIKTRIINGIINNNGNASSAFTGIQLLNSFDCDIRDALITTNSGTSLIGIDINGSNRCIMQSCIIRNNTAATASLQGIKLSGSLVAFNLMNNCIVEQNSAATAFSGITLQANAQNNSAESCIVNGNSGSGQVAGFELVGGVANNFQNSFFSCIAHQNSASGSGNRSNGYRIDGSNYGILSNCVASSNSSAASVAAGIEFVSGTGGNFWLIEYNNVLRNVGSSAANSYGILRSTGSNNLWTHNIGFNNNSTAANQLSGVPSVTTPGAPATNNLNGSSYNVWTNMAIAQ